MSSAATSLFPASQQVPAVGEPIPILRERRHLGLFMRRAVDLTLLLAIAPIAVVVVAILAIAVKIDSPGPAFVFLDRLGKRERPFKLVKLRSMVSDAEALKASIWKLNALQGPDFKVIDDPRVTRLGKWLRKSSLDELPQLWNVLRNDMTLMGPRPCSVSLDKYKLWQTERLEVTPGLLGRWQAEGRGRTDFDSRCRMDIAQVRSRSLVATVRAAFGSLVSIVTARGAY